jgi:toxin ParE1/3/4
LRVVWLKAAKEDRHETLSYIAADNPTAAERMDRLFSEAADRLGKFPFVGRAGSISGTRELIPHENYRLVYQVDDDTVWILALIHTSRQWPPAEPAP